jgi:ATP-dependent exoDNAse (exonuclease V) beta subunit
MTMAELIKMTDAEYFAHDALNNTFLKNFKRGPAYAFQEHKPSAAMEYGTLVHTFMLQPELFNDLYLIAPAGMPADKRLKGYKQLKADNPEKTVIFRDDFNALGAIKRNILNQVADSNMHMAWSNSMKEITVLFECYGYECKVKIDLLWLDHNSSEAYIIDLKTTDDCTRFHQSVRYFDYDMQAAFYTLAVQQLHPGYAVFFLFMPVEKEAPHGVMIRQLSSAYMQHGLNKVESAIKKYAAWQQRGSDKTETYPAGIETIGLPDFLKGDTE